MESFVIQNNTSVGSYFSLFDSEGLLREKNIKPSYLVHTDLEPLTNKSNSKKVSFDIKTLAQSDLETDAEIVLLWVHVQIPEQKVQNKSDKVSYNQHFSGLDLIKKISYHSNSSEKSYKEHTRATYRLELQNLLGSKFGAFHDQYLDLTKRLSYQQNISNNDFSHIEEETLHFPIFFRPHLKPFLVDESTKKSSSFKIEIVFNEISKLFTKSVRHMLTSFDVSKATATLVTKFFNDQVVNEHDHEHGLIQTENIFQALETKITYSDADDSKATQFKVDVKEGNKNPVNNIFFAIDDQSFSSQHLFYGKTVNESVKCYINSCFKLHSDNSNCVDLSSLNGWNSNGWSAKYIDSSHVLLRFTTLENQQYETILISKTINFEDLHQVYIDLEVSSVIKLYWFKQIELEFNFYNQSHILAEDWFNGAQKILNGQFKFDEMPKKNNLKDQLAEVKSLDDENDENNNEQVEMHYKENSSFVFLGATNFNFNKKIPVKWSNKGTIAEKEKYLTQKHFEVFFSLPVISKDASPFSKLDFVVIDYCDYNWMDLDRKYQWNIKEIKITKDSDLNFLIKYNENTLKSMRYNQPFDMPQLAITSAGLVGYCDLKDYSFVVEYGGSEFFQMKPDPCNLIKLNCYVSNYKFFNYQKRKFFNVKLKTIQKMCNCEQFQELFEDETTNNNRKKFKIKSLNI